jgi:Flp pilus assembly protein TadD
MALESNDEPNYGILAQRFSSAQQWDRSLATSLEWLARQPESLPAHRVAAQSLINLDRAEEARPHVEKVLAGHPNDDFAHRLMAIVHYRTGKFRLAYESIQRAISLDPNDAHHWQQLAHMSRLQGDLETARKSIARARELNPLDADIFNLSILCEPQSAGTATLRQFEQALALDPENAVIHNNIGTQHLNNLHDYAQAEECFRHALALDPANKTFRKNLFLVVKKRDLAYRALCAPKDWLMRVIFFVGKLRKRNLLLYILVIPVWILTCRFIIGGLVLWFALVWPLVKVYEYLTIGDIRARVGELGVRRGGFLGYRRWPLQVRLSIFAAFLIAFWGGVAWFFLRKTPPGQEDYIQPILGAFLFLGFVGIMGYSIWLRLKGSLKARAARKNARRLEGVFAAKHGDEA